MTDEIVSVNDSKYSVHMPHDGRLYACQYGEYWRDCCGDKLIHWLAVELREANERIMILENKC